MIKVANPIQLVMKFECNAVGRTGGSSIECRLVGWEIGSVVSIEGLGEVVASKRGDLEVLRDGTPGRDSAFRKAGYSCALGECGVRSDERR